MITAVTAAASAVLLLAPAVTAVAAAPPATLEHSGSDYTLSNGYVSVTFSSGGGLLHPGPSLKSLKGDHEGKGAYGEELLAGFGFALLGDDKEHNTASSADALQAGKPVVKIVSSGPQTAAIEVSGIAAGTANEVWTISLAAGSRAFELSTIGEATLGGAGAGMIRHALLAKPLSVFGFYPADGVVQMMNAAPGRSVMPSARPIGQVYMIGGVNPSNTKPKPEDSSQGAIDISFPDGPAGTTALLSGPSALPGKSGFSEILVGTVRSDQLDSWTNHTVFSANAVSLPRQVARWHTKMLVTPNNRNFPAGNMTTGPNLPIDDLAAVMTGIYGSAPGCLCTFPNAPACPGLQGKHEHLGQIATTVARPDRGYGGTYNYFDPDNFFSMTALIYSGEKFLQEQARTVIERSGKWLCIGDVQKSENCTYGQLPHHFVGDKPTFLALSGATQTGPNTFWTKAALQYARNAGDMAWLKAYMPTLRASSAFCFDLIDDETHLLLAPGSLMIDVFIRQNYTADSNAMMVGFLNEFADAEAAVGNHTGATALKAKAVAMANAMNELMYDTDHYVTQVNPDDMNCAKTHSCRDFIDYDSNTIAVAHSVPTTKAQGRAVLHRIDSGGPAKQKCQAAQGGGPQWTSEIWYGPRDTTGAPHGNIGDSCSAMGRIAWFDAKARKVVGDVAGFDKALSVLQKDLLFYTWMHERYGCDGKMQTNRTAAYFEYPSTVAILLREIKYGIHIGFAQTTVAPLMQTPTAFSYHVGDVNIDYHPDGLTRINTPSLTPATQPREYRLHNMKPETHYVAAPVECDVSVSLAANRLIVGIRTDSLTTVTDADGMLSVFMANSNNCGIEVQVVP